MQNNVRWAGDELVPCSTVCVCVCFDEHEVKFTRQMCVCCLSVWGSAAASESDPAHRTWTWSQSRTELLIIKLDVDGSRDRVWPGLCCRTHLRVEPGLRRPPVARVDPAAVKPAGHVGTRRDSVKPVPWTGAHAEGGVSGGFRGSLRCVYAVSGVGPAGLHWCVQNVFWVCALWTLRAQLTCGTGDRHSDPWNTWIITRLEEECVMWRQWRHQWALNLQFKVFKVNIPEHHLTSPDVTWMCHFESDDVSQNFKV